MEKAAEVYTRLKSRVLGPKIEAIQKAARTGAEKERTEAEKAEAALGGEEPASERAEDEASAGEELGAAGRAPQPRWRGWRGLSVFSGQARLCPRGIWGLVHAHAYAAGGLGALSQVEEGAGRVQAGCA